MREIMDVISNPRIRKVVVMKGAQVAYTEGIGLNTIGYYIAQDPCPVLVILPTIELAESWSKDRLAPMLRDTPALAHKVLDGRVKDGDTNTIRNKMFKGGRLTLLGANAPAGLASRPIRIVIGDEVDRWPVNTGGTKRGEGDPLALAAKRQITFWNRKTLIGSTPVIKETSVIFREFTASDQRFYYCPCHECGEAQVLKWQQVRWDKKGDEHMAETAHYVCEHCGAIWNEPQRQEAIKAGFWVADKPTKDVAGFHISGFMSPWLTLPEIVQEFLDSRHDPELFQVWVNTILGEPWEGATEKVSAESIRDRGENYSPEDIPDDVLFLTAGVDVQHNRLEMQVLGWGPKDEVWVIDYQVINGDPNDMDVWETLDEQIKAPYRTAAGRRMFIRTTCVDSGGNATAAVLSFCKDRWRRRIYAVKGLDGPRSIWPRKASKSKKGNIDFYSIGVDTAKDLSYGKLKVIKPGPGYVHFPAGEDFGKVYFDQLTSEYVEIRKHEGRPYRVWVLPSSKTNEALDTFVYAVAARYSMRVRKPPGGQQQVAQPGQEVIPETSTKPEPAPAAEQQPPPQAALTAGKHSMFQGGSWMSGRGRNWFDRS